MFYRTRSSPPHQRFGHLHSLKLYELLRKTKLENVSKEKMRQLQDIERNCGKFQRLGQYPSRFKFTIKDEVYFNHSVYVDVFYMKSCRTRSTKAITHVVYEAMRYQDGFHLADMRAEMLWRAVRQCWIDACLDLPHVLVHDDGSNFLACSFHRNADLLFIRFKAVPLEAVKKMTYVERHHHPVCRAFNIFEQEYPNLPFDDCLQTANNAANDSVGPDGSVTTLLVFWGFSSSRFFSLSAS